MRVMVEVPRPQNADVAIQGYRGPFAPLLLALEFLTQLDEWLLQQVEHPPLYQAGVVYRPEPFGKKDYDEHFKNINELIRDGWGDCDDIAPARAAELRHLGIAAKCAIKWKFIKVSDKKILRQMGKHRPFILCMIHVLVEWPDGTIEDPCAKLGMKGEYQ